MHAAMWMGVIIAWLPSTARRNRGIVSIDDSSLVKPRVLRIVAVSTSWYY